jgi:uncharacterized protein YjiS (DUF1127 family)
MTTKTTTTALPFGAITTHRLIASAFDLVDRIVLWRDTRRTVALLRTLSPSQLEDIGIEPGELDGFTRKSR